jgi:hypothetical protein
MQRVLVTALPAAKPGTATYSRLATTEELPEQSEAAQKPKRPRVEDEAPASSDSETVIPTAAIAPDTDMPDIAAAGGDVELQDNFDEKQGLESSDDEDKYQRPVPKDELEVGER